MKLARSKKVLEYRRARFLDAGQNLEHLVRQAWGQFQTQAERTITFSDNRSSCGLRSCECNGNGFAIHCGKYTDGQGVGTIPTTPAPEVVVGERAPEPGENFLNSDLMALIRGNHVISMNCGRNAGSLRIYLQQLFRKAGFSDAARQFELVRIGSLDKLAIIHAIGVMGIDLQFDISEVTASEVIDGARSDSMWRTFKRSFGDAFKAVTARDESVEQLRSAERVTVTVSIKVPTGDLDVAKNGLNEFSEEVVEDEEADSFVIHLRDRSTIRPHEVSVRKEVSIEAAANTVSVFQTWDEMETYMAELLTNGQLEA